MGKTKLNVPSVTEMKANAIPRTGKRNKLKALLSGESLSFNNYRLEPVFEVEGKTRNLIAVNIFPILRDTKTFWHYNGSPKKVSKRKTGARLKTGITLFMFDIDRGMHRQNEKIPKTIKEFLDEVQKMVILL